MVLDDVNSQDGILVSTIFVLHATVHITTQLTLAQLVFEWDSILNTCHKGNYRSLRMV